AEALDADATQALLLRGGITTAASVSQVAGRGVGLDVVRETAARLKGAVRVHSAPGRGATFEVEVPVSLQSHRALVVDAGGTSCSLSLDEVVTTLRLADGELVRLDGRDLVVQDGVAIPFAPLAELLGAPLARAPGRPWSVVVLKDAAGRVAVGADRILGAADTVVRALPAIAGVLPVVAGAALDEAGDPRLVLDAASLASAARARTAATAAPAPARRLPVLVIDDSLTTRMLAQSILESA